VFGGGRCFGEPVHPDAAQAESAARRDVVEQARAVWTWRARSAPLRSKKTASGPARACTSRSPRPRRRGGFDAEGLLAGCDQVRVAVREDRQPPAVGAQRLQDGRHLGERRHAGSDPRERVPSSGASGAPSSAAMRIERLGQDGA